MSIYAEIFLGGAALVFSGLLVRYTRKVAQYTKEYTEETRRLWEVTKKSYFVETTVNYIIEKHYGRIKEWPSVVPGWTAFLKMKWPPPDEEKPRIFRNDCDRIVLEALFPEEIKLMEMAVVKNLKEKGYKFREEGNAESNSPD